MTTKLIPVQSSNLEAVGYNPRNKTLTVEFKNQAQYEYSNVPKSVYDALLSADSVGGYFASHIRNSYPTRKVGG